MADRKSPPSASREDRLKQALKANLARRKAQAKARSTQDETETSADKSKGST